MLFSVAFLLLACGSFLLLGNWQVKRLSWKQDLIARVEAGQQAPAVPVPVRSQWPAIDVEHYEYRKVCADGLMLHEQETLVQASTRLGSGSWVLTPLHSPDGSFILINRGFVDVAHRVPESRSASQPPIPVHVCGLLRLPEPRGAVLRRNDPTNGRWYSRDVMAIAATRGLPVVDVAPYFIDADAHQNTGGWPVGGLTILKFYNGHLLNAIIWYTLALASVVGIVVLIRYERALAEPTHNRAISDVQK